MIAALGYLCLKTPHSQNILVNESYDQAFNDNQATIANIALQKAIEKSMQDLILEPGDIVFVNNRTAIHGRSKPQTSEEGKGRWLMRSYGIQNETKVYPLSTDKPYLLSP